MSVLLRDLDGITVARLVLERNGSVTLTLSAPAGFGEQGYYPAESIAISNEAVAELRMLLNEAFATPAPAPVNPPLPAGAAKQSGGFKL